MSHLKTAQEFMRRKLITLAPGTNVLDGVRRLLKNNISGAPVVDLSGRYMGVFSEKCSMNAMTATVELAEEADLAVGSAREIMKCDLITLKPEICVFEAIDHILGRRISGAPVVDPDGKFLGIFSEKTAMRVLMAAAYDQFPGSNVGTFMNTDRRRIVDEECSLLDVAHRFQQTPYRRLPVLRDEKLEGQISRRDVLRAELHLADELSRKIAAGMDGVSGVTTTADVESFMDRDARTISPQEDLLSVAQIFLNTPYRRLPVIQDGQLLGQVSRRDLLEAAAECLRPKAQRPHAETLYLSPLSDAIPPSLG